MVIEMITLALVGLVAAFFGTIAMTISQEIEIKICKRPISYTPAIAVFKILHLDFEQLSTRTKGFFSYVVHFGYGTKLGLAASLLFYLGIINFWPLTLIFFLIVWIQGLIVVPLLGIAGPPWTWGAQAILIEMFHKIIYSLATVWVFLYFIAIFL